MKDKNGTAPVYDASSIQVLKGLEAVRLRHFCYQSKVLWDWKQNVFVDMQKYSFEFVSDQFSSKQCILLEDAYISSAHPMRYKCSCGIINDDLWNMIMELHVRSDLHVQRDMSKLIESVNHQFLAPAPRGE